MWPPLGNRFRQRSSYIETIGRTPNIVKHVFCYLKNIWCLNVIFFNSIQLGKLYGAYFALFFGKKYFPSPDPFFVMYNDSCKLFIIRAVSILSVILEYRYTFIPKKGFSKLNNFQTKIIPGDHRIC